MSNETNSSNFIKNIVINDLETGKHDSIKPAINIIVLVIFFHFFIRFLYYSNAYKITAFSAENLVLPHTKCLT